MKRLPTSIKILCLCLLLLLQGIVPRHAQGDERPTNPGIVANTVELVSYQSAGYRFQTIPAGTMPPLGFEQPDFNDGAFQTGDAAFGAGTGGLGAQDCPLRSGVRTEWPLQSQLLIRRHIDIPLEATGVRLMVSVDNDILGVFFNGVRLSTVVNGQRTRTVRHDNCPIRDEFRFDVPQSLINSGQGTVALHVLDRPGRQGQANESFFDMRVLAEASVPQILSSIGSLTPLVDSKLPREPISDVTIACPALNGIQSGSGQTDITFRVAKTGALGQISATAISAANPDDLKVDLFLANEWLASTRSRGSTLNVEVNPRLVDVPDETLRQDVWPFDSVLRNSEVEQKLGTCLAPPVGAGTAQCKQACASSARKSRIVAFAITKGSFFTGLGALADEGIEFVANLAIEHSQCACNNCCDAGENIPETCVSDLRRPKRFSVGCS